MNEETQSQEAELEQQDSSDGEPESATLQETEEVVEESSVEEPTLPAEPEPTHAENDAEYWKQQAKKNERLLKKLQSQTEAQPVRNEFVTKAEFYKANETKAIQEVQAENPEFKEHWKDIVGYFPNNADRSTPETVKEALYDAHALWKRRQASSETQDTSVKAKLASSTGKGGSSPNATPEQRKKILQKPASIDEWY